MDVEMIELDDGGSDETTPARTRLGEDETVRRIKVTMNCGLGSYAIFELVAFLPSDVSTAVRMNVTTRSGLRIDGLYEDQIIDRSLTPRELCQIFINELCRLTDTDESMNTILKQTIALTAEHAIQRDLSEAQYRRADWAAIGEPCPIRPGLWGGSSVAAPEGGAESEFDDVHIV